MSADNEIAIVKFPNNSYRVAEIRGCPGKDDLEWVLTAFAKDFAESEVYWDYDSAYSQAEKMEQIIEASGYLEYGFSDWESKEPLESYIDGLNNNGKEADEYLRSLLQAEIVQL